MEPLTKGFPGKLQPRRINLLKRGNYMKGSKGWMLNPLSVWHGSSRPRWLLPVDTINMSRICCPRSSPLYRKGLRAPFSGHRISWISHQNDLHPPTSPNFPFNKNQTTPNNTECLNTRSRACRTWEICMMNPIPMIRETCLVCEIVSFSFSLTNPPHHSVFPSCLSTNNSSQQANKQATGHRHFS